VTCDPPINGYVVEGDEPGLAEQLRGWAIELRLPGGRRHPIESGTGAAQLVVRVE
jgi:hypothetical protein